MFRHVSTSSICSWLSQCGLVGLLGVLGSAERQRLQRLRRRMVEVRPVEVAEFRATEELIREDEKGGVENLMEKPMEYGKINVDQNGKMLSGSKPSSFKTREA